MYILWKIEIIFIKKIKNYEKCFQPKCSSLCSSLYNSIYDNFFYFHFFEANEFCFQLYCSGTQSTQWHFVTGCSCSVCCSLGWLNTRQEQTQTLIPSYRTQKCRYVGCQQAENGGRRSNGKSVCSHCPVLGYFYFYVSQPFIFKFLLLYNTLGSVKLCEEHNQLFQLLLDIQTKMTLKL